MQNETNEIFIERGTCYRCEKQVPANELKPFEDYMLCDECYNFINNCEHASVNPYMFTNSYEYKPQRTRRERVADVPFYLGVELECECEHINTQLELRDIKNSIPCIMATDGSLSTRGAVEIITEPLSFKKWKELEPNFKALWKRLIHYGYKSHDARTTGLHIHVTRPSDEVIDRILFIMETYKNELVKFARRGSVSYCTWYSDDYHYSNEQLKSLDFIKNNKNTSERYLALNLTNTKTIEFRFFKGTLNGQTYMACVELINNLVTLCSDLKRPLSRITWNLLTQGTNCKEYCKERGISKSNIMPKDMTSEFLRQYRKDKGRVSKAIKILNNELLKQTSLFQLFIKTELPAINNTLNDNQFNTNITTYSQVICTKARELSSITQYINELISDLKNGIKKNGFTTTDWLDNTISNFISCYGNKISNYTKEQLKALIKGVE